MADFNSKKEYRCIEMIQEMHPNAITINEAVLRFMVFRCSFCTFMYFSKLFMIEKFSFSVRKKVIEITKLYQRG